LLRCESLVSVTFGWSSLKQRIEQDYPDIQIDQNPQDLNKNIGRLDEVVRLLHGIVIGYKERPTLWRPLIEGMVRQRDKYPDIPSHHHMNMTGGLPTALIEVGMLGSITNTNSMLYVISGNNLPDRHTTSISDEAVMKTIRLLYEKTLRAGGISMNFIFKPMNQDNATEIADWHYDGAYSFYDMVSDPKDLEEFLDPIKRESSYFSVYDDKVLIGFFSFHKIDHTVDIGLGLRPDLTGKGLGFLFLLTGMEFAKNKYSPTSFSLAVATFNQRGIKVYERAGFRPVKGFIQETNGGQYEFVKMVAEA
jgi:ribosomal-protein-alanine N-acetyltransferase